MIGLQVIICCVPNLIQTRRMWDLSNKVPFLLLNLK